MGKILVNKVELTQEEGIFMYTVIRFNIPSEMDILSPVVIQLGELINEKDSNTFKGEFDTCGNRISLDVAKNQNWEILIDSIISAINNFDKVIKYANTNGIRIELDIAFYASDLKDDYISFTWECSYSFLKLLVDNQITLVHTYYDDVERVAAE